MTQDHSEFLLPKSLIYALALVSLGLSLWLAWTMLYFRSGDDSARSGPRIYLPSGRPGSDAPLLSFEWIEAGRALRAVAGAPEPTGSSAAPRSTAADTVRADQPLTIRIGRYWYRFQLRVRRATNGVVARMLEWELLGVRLELGDGVGRAPDFLESGRLGYDPNPDTHMVSLWMDAMPTSAFRLRAPTDCRGATVCLDVTGGAGRMTVERETVPAVIHHAADGERIGLGERDRLWIGHLSYRFTPAPDAAGAFDFRVTDDFARYRGDRRNLGSAGFHGGTGRLESDAPIRVHDVVSQFRTGHLSDLRWNPQTEDEYQALVDFELLCSAATTEGPRVVPQLVWAELTSPGCHDSIAGTRQDRSPMLPRRVAEIYRRRRVNDDLVRRTNEILREGAATRPQDIPFVFEWWPVSTPGTLVKMPLRLWGVRTMTTYRQLDPAPVVARSPADRPIVLQNAARRVVLAETIAGRREYAPGRRLLGLGPLLGIRGVVDGLDEVVPGIPLATAADEIRLTIDPDLQERLWTSLANAAKVYPIDGGPRRLHGFSAVALNGSTGDVLSVLNWPEALKWETPDQLAELSNQSTWGMPRNAVNTAMLRADKVGSVFKLLAMYAMADAGVLDSRRPGASPPGCLVRPIRVVQSRAVDGRLDPIEGIPFRDGQPGLLPVGHGGISHALTGATGASCNSYFALAAFLLLNDAVPEVEWRDRCPVDAARRFRIDAGASRTRWMLCSQSFPRGSPFPVEHWLMPPAGERLDIRGISGFANPGARASGYFARALDAGFRFTIEGQAERGMPTHTAYRNVAVSGSWMPAMPGAEGRVFEYPTMLSPGSQFGLADQTGGHIAGVYNGWRSFASQAIGEAGQGSALSVGVMYAAVARGDGHVPAPRLLASSDPPSLRRIFAFDRTRQARIEEALRAPLRPGGTAFMALRRLPFLPNMLGKTGTFLIEHDPTRPHESVLLPDAVTRASCGVLETNNGALLKTDGAAQLGTAICEGPSLLVTGIHRYPEGPQPMAPATGAERGDPVGEDFTTFATIIRPPQGSSAPPIVFVLIADIDEYAYRGSRAAELVPPLLTDIWQWMQSRTS